MPKQTTLKLQNSMWLCSLSINFVRSKSRVAAKVTFAKCGLRNSHDRDVAPNASQPTMSMKRRWLPGGAPCILRFTTKQKEDKPRVCRRTLMCASIIRSHIDDARGGVHMPASVGPVHGATHELCGSTNGNTDGDSRTATLIRGAMVGVWCHRVH